MMMIATMYSNEVCHKGMNRDDKVWILPSCHVSIYLHYNTADMFARVLIFYSKNFKVTTTKKCITIQQ